MRTCLFIIILLLNNFAFSQTLNISSISFEGNKVTKEKILLAELDIQVNDSIQKIELDQILKKNSDRLYNLQLFHWVKYSYKTNPNNSINITFSLQERWYIWPIPIFSLSDRNLNAWLSKMDFDRIDYGIHTAWYNFRGRNEQLTSNIQHGFNRKYEVFYKIPQLNKKQNVGLELGVSYFQSHYIDYINENAQPKTIQLNNDFPIQRKYFRVGLINRKTVENINNIRFEVNEQLISDSVLKLNPLYHLNSKHKTYIQIELSKTLNKRNSFSYPTNGSYLEVSLRQRMFVNQIESNSTRIQLDYSKYIPFNSKVFYSFGVNSQYTYRNNKSFSTSENIALGYKKNVRGFDNYIIDGQDMYVLKQNINMKVLNNKLVKLNFIPTSKFNEIPLSIYINTFYDLGFVNDSKYILQNTLSNEVLYSTGVGLHFTTYYDQVFVIDYTFNSLQEHGIFISTSFPI